METFGLVLVVVGGVLQLGGLASTVVQAAKHVDSIRDALPLWLVNLLRLPRPAVVAVAAAVHGEATFGGVAVVVGEESDTERLMREVAALQGKVATLSDELKGHAKWTRREFESRSARLQADEAEQATSAKADARTALWGVVVIGVGILAQTVGSVL